MKEKLMTLARRVQEKAGDLEVIRRQGNRVLVRLASSTGGRLRRVTREWLEYYDDWLDAGEDYPGPRRKEVIT